MILKKSKLGDVCKIQSGNSIAPKEKDDLYRNINEGLPYVATKDIGLDGSINFENGVRIPSKFDKKFRLSEKNSVLVCAEGGSAGKKIAYSNKDCYFVNKLFSIKPINEINSKYIYYYTLSNVFQKKFKESLHGLIGGVSLSKIKNFQIGYPSLSEQQQIVAKLDAAFAEIDKGISQIQKSIENTNLLFEEKIKQFFIHNITNSPIVKLSDISEYFNGLTYSPKDVSKDGIIVLRSGNIQNGKMKYQDIKRVNKKIKDKLYVKPTDILICSRNGSQRLIGKSSLIGEIKEPMTFGTFMMILRSEHNKYLQWFIKSKLFKKQILKGENTMINQITRYMLDDISLPFPDKKIYSKIAKELELLDEHIRILNKILNIKIDNFRTLKSSILKHEIIDKEA